MSNETVVYDVEIEGQQPILFNRMLPGRKLQRAECLDKSSHWRDRLYYDEEGNVYIPPQTMHACMRAACKYWGKKIQGSRRTYTTVVEKAAIVTTPLLLGVKKDSGAVLPYTSQIGLGGKRVIVTRILPMIEKWKASFRMVILDDRLTEDVIKTIFGYAGSFIGLLERRAAFGTFELTALGRRLND